MKYQSTNSEIIIPGEILKTFKKNKIDISNPSMYSMMSWITQANEYSGTSGMTFEEVITYAAYFYSQRSREEGLKYIFQLFDPNRKGYLTRHELDQAFAHCGLILSKPQVREIF